MRLRFELYIVLFTCLIGSCIDPVTLEPKAPDDLLIVEGFITDQVDEFEVVVSRLTKFTSNRGGGTERIVGDAEVFITDQNGTRTDLRREERIRLDVLQVCRPGCCPTSTYIPVTTLGYRTPAGFKGEIGNTYTLTVITFNGRIYQSTPQTIIAGPKVDSVTYQYKRLPSIDPVLFRSGIDVFVNWQDPLETKNFYGWRINGMYRIETPNIQGQCCLYDPGDPLATNSCWIYEKGIKGGSIAFSDIRGNGESIFQRVGFIEDDGLRFGNIGFDPAKQYYIEIEQLNMSAETFAFNNRLASQLEIDGDIFDPPPAEVRGNMSNINNPDEVVIGYFAAYSVQKAGVFVNRNDLEEVQPWPGACGDCRARAWSTQEVPEPFR